MRIHTAGDDEEEAINLMPLIDMVFLLLVFFLVATTIAQEERDSEIELPTASTLAPLSAPPPQLVVNVRDDGTIKVGKQTVTMEQLGTMLKKVAQESPDKELLVRADMNSFHKYFAGVVKTARESGIGKAKIGYIIQSQPGQTPPQ